ncbi:MAG: beta-lactamase family protein [Acidimicrobiia bacterium]|nr:beta-lactamase family protein [Acidimicrobiia bacterium]
MSALAVSVISPTGSVTSVEHSAEGETPTDRTLFLTGSLGKTMMAATTLLLAEEGVLDLDEPIERWLPEFPRADEISLRQLLSHTAGLQEQREGTDISPGPEALAALQETKTQTELLAEAASAVGDGSLPASHRYSNAGYWVVATIIESATGESLNDVLRGHVFEPLGMADTYAEWSATIDQDIVGGELTLPDGEKWPLGTEHLPAVMSRQSGAGDFLSSSRDVATFYRAMLRDLMAPASVEAMTTIPAGSDYGLGISMREWQGGITGWGHDGLTDGYSVAAGLADGWTVAVLTNQVDLADANGSHKQARARIGEVLAHINANG